MGVCYSALGLENEALDSYRTCGWALGLELRVFDKEKVTQVQRFIQEAVREEEGRFEAMRKVRTQQASELLRQTQRPRVLFSQDEITGHIDALWSSCGSEQPFECEASQRARLSQGKEEWTQILHKICGPSRRTTSWSQAFR